MRERVLVAFGSKFGSTTEIAQAIGETLADEGLEVDVLPANEVRGVDAYRAVIVGSAVYTGRWRRDALRLLRKHRDALAARDVWLFSSGPVGEQKPEAAAQNDRWTRPRKVEALADEIGAHSHVVFGGMVSEAGGGFMRKSMARNTDPKFLDLRDWDEIRTWARGIAGTLAGRQAAPSHS